jgi:hypothetical protein
MSSLVKGFGLNKYLRVCLKRYLLLYIHMYFVNYCELDLRIMMLCSSWRVPPNPHPITSPGRVNMLEISPPPPFVLAARQQRANVRHPAVLPNTYSPLVVWRILLELSLGCLELRQW